MYGRDIFERLSKNQENRNSQRSKLEGMFNKIGTENGVSKEIIIGRMKKYSLEFGQDSWFKNYYQKLDKKYESLKNN